MRAMLAGVLLVAVVGAPLRAAEPQQCDVLVYGATPAGIAAALAAADSGENVVLVEPTSRIGGLVTNGLSHTDFRTFEGLTGTFLTFSKRVEAYYAKKYGPDSPQARESFRGTFGEPHVNLAVFQEMIAECKGIHTAPRYRLDDVKLQKSDSNSRIESATFVGPEGERWTIRASIFIDASYEGDLMAKAGVPWKIGREGRAEHGESLAPANGDVQLQAYNFRWVMTKNPRNRVAPVAPPGYRREDFTPVLDVLATGKIKSIFGYPGACIFKAHLPPLPNDKYDINDVSNGLVRLSLPGKNLTWAEGDAAAREAVFHEHQREQVGLLYFLQTDAMVPQKFREEAKQWGWCQDEFADTGHQPGQLYVRESRRMVGQYVFTEKDTEHARDDARAVLHTDSIAMGDYGNNCHGTFHEGPRFGGKHTGEFYKPVSPYQIPYGVIVPKNIMNLLVPVAASSSHVGYCALRLEPIWCSLGEAAGHAAHLARQANAPVQNVPVSQLQRRLHMAGSATLYVSDVLPGHADFDAVQWWGTAGGFHGLAATPANRGQRGKNITGQYFEAYPNHAAELQKVLEPELANRWGTLAESLGLPRGKFPKLDGKLTRGDWLRAMNSLATTALKQPE